MVLVHILKDGPSSMMEIAGVGSLPRDLIIEILSRLPVKVLCKFRCVSKHWLGLISFDECFLSRHRQLSKSNPLLLYRSYSSGQTTEEKKHKVMVDLTSIDMDGTCDNKIRAPTGGPIYTFTSCGHLIFLRCMYRLYVCNPGTREFVSVPRASLTDPYYTVGFGYLCGSNEYKIVHLFFQESFVSDEGMACEVFTLRDGEGVDSGSWKRVNDCPYKVWTDRLPVCVDGVIYWMVSEQSNSIVLFDMKTEEFGVISYPGWYSELDSNSLFLVGLNGFVCLVYCLAAKSTMDIWMLKDCKNSIWVKGYSISLSATEGSCEILGIVPCEEDDGEILINTEQKGLVCYNINSKTFRSIENKERYKKPCLYHESFFSLHNH
ncbi:F-box protein At1g11270-like [Cornus florida]|uniref:F-box protein At1g11270-like n=1 Tax=Cornus florida TaxID=4283 RepID=UPI00289E91A6|nr:F-box protein At1g11270-like [Cornus florida]